MADQPASPPPPAKAGILVLAAGASRRLGHPKQLLPFAGTTLLRHAAGTALASRVGPVFVVLGSDAGRCESELSGLPVEIVIHAGWAEGMGSSLRAGVAAAEQRFPGIGALVVTTCDQPRVEPRTLRQLAEACHGPTHSLAACAYAGAVGVPAAFQRRHFPALLALSGDHGARPLLLRHADRLASVPCPEAALDVDTDADLAQLI